MPTPYRMSLLRDNINTEIADNVDRLVDAQAIRENLIEVAESLFDIIGDTGRSYASTITKDGSTVGALSLNGSQLITNGNLVIGTGTGSGSYLSINPGTSATAPIVLSSGTNTATARAGAIEYDGSNFYATVSGPSRKTILFTDRNINTTAPLTGSGNLSSDITLGISLANAGTNGYLSSVDWTTFNSKLSSTPVGSSGQIIYNNGTSYAGATGLSYTSGSLTGYEKQSNKDQPSGYAGLDASGNLLATSIIPRAGTATGIDVIVLDNGEIATTTDTHKIRIGDGSRAGGWEVGGTNFYNVSLASGATYQIPNGRDVYVFFKDDVYSPTGVDNVLLEMPNTDDVVDGDRLRIFISGPRLPPGGTNYLINFSKYYPSGWGGYSLAAQSGSLYGSIPSGFQRLDTAQGLFPSVSGSSSSNAAIYMDMTLHTDFQATNPSGAGILMYQIYGAEIGFA